MAETAVTQDNDSTAPEGAEGSATTPTAPKGTGSGDRVTLESRLAGLEARLAEQGRSKSAAERERDAIAQKLADYEAGKLTETDALNSELVRANARAAAAEKTAKLARIEARFPETFAVFGETAADLSEESLAAAEARFKGAVSTEPEESPTPRLPSAGRPAVGKDAPKDGAPEPTLEQLRHRLKTEFAPFGDNSNW